MKKNKDFALNFKTTLKHIHVYTPTQYMEYIGLKYKLKKKEVYERIAEKGWGL